MIPNINQKFEMLINLICFNLIQTSPIPKIINVTCIIKLIYYKWIKCTETNSRINFVVLTKLLKDYKIKNLINLNDLDYLIVLLTMLKRKLFFKLVNTKNKTKHS